jgi:2-keto-4-pentenoate hydratase/2-oxohepta-3-ene-1,7-dioic acid hydratase in catechol pathway
MRLATLRTGECVVIDGDRCGSLPGRLIDHFGRAVVHPRDWKPFDPALLGPPLTPRQLICVGLNYRDHAQETGAKIPERPILFGKLPSSIVGPGDPIVRPRGVSRLDHECELAVVIGRATRDVSEANALDYVGGYTCLDDVTDREAQSGDGQWFRGKSRPTFAPIGPWVVTPDELSDPSDLAISCAVNGEVRQSSRTSQLIFGVAALVAYCSANFDLGPGDVIATGTPGGVGLATGRWLEPGDIVEVSVEGVGVLRNEVVDQPARASAAR